MALLASLRGIFPEHSDCHAEGTGGLAASAMLRMLLAAVDNQLNLQLHTCWVSALPVSYISSPIFTCYFDIGFYTIIPISLEFIQ